MSKLRNLNILTRKRLPTPQEVRSKVTPTSEAITTVETARKSVQKILSGDDPRLFIVVGPCSIHDLKAAKEYAECLTALACELSDTFVVLMRTYFEKPRTTVGWKGFINDPRLDGSFQIDEGLHLARQLMCDINSMGLPVATEALDPVTPQYLDDLIAWSAIGARTTESQTHREMASGLSTPVGFKNGTNGSIQVAVNALKSVSEPHHFLGIDQDGQCCIFHTAGNRYAHIVLRGGGGAPNYDPESITKCEQALKQANLKPVIMLDCSHGNSNKDPERQLLVLESCIDQVVNGNRSIKGLMLESNLYGGKQPFTSDRSKLKYGVSVTDGCLAWDTTERILREARDKLQPALKP